ncbi:25S rRNA (uracil2634-N3)-methyltransferase [Sporobolomyces salmoneus]|uniref:25S rRNA (uracil2634-N3)-methyltransferase n=1 Tax=Sporobolomyces salmoneus TaxID=183962 RepID=UPI00317E6FE5
MGKKPSVGRPKGKNVLAKALSGQQQKQHEKELQQRAEQAAKDRANAAKNKIVQQKKSGINSKKRKLATNASTSADAEDGENVAAEGGEEEGMDGEELREKRALERKKAFAQPFRRGERVLLVGEGNFSFAHSLLLPQSTASSTTPYPPLPLVTPSMLLCTSFDSHKVALEKYPDLEAHLEPLRTSGATVLFDVDATKLESNKQVMEFCGRKSKGKGKGKASGENNGWEEVETRTGFDKIVFNFPHVGQGITDQDRNIRTNQTLLLDFYLSASQLLRNGASHLASASKSSSSRLSRSPSPPTLLDESLSLPSLDPTQLPPPPPPKTRGTILVTLRTQPPYSLWLPAHLATKPLLLLPSILPPTSLKTSQGVPRVKLQPSFKTVKSWEFEPTHWEGYEHRRTLGWDEKKSFIGNQDITLTTKERKRLGDQTAVNTRLNRGGKKGGGKEEKGTGMRTWEFELVVKEYDGPARDGGWSGNTVGAKRKRGGKDSDRDDDDSD